MNDASVGNIIRDFKNYRLQQKSRMDQIMAYTSSFERVFSDVSAIIGNDPIKNEPIARVARQMNDYQRRWGVSLAPIYGPALSLVIDASGALKLNDDQGEIAIEDVLQTPEGIVLLPAPDNSPTRKPFKLQDYLLEFVARQLKQAIQNRAAIQ